MEINSKMVLEVLRGKGTEHLYHANTVRTASTFLRAKRLHSRGVLDEQGLDQTPQLSDAKDKKYGLWYDIFLDACDIHRQANVRNKYGPVLFVFDVELLAEDWLASVWVTKTNPWYWQDTTPLGERYFSVDEFAEKYNPNTFNYMIVLRHVGGVLRLVPHLKEIILDDPRRTRKQLLGTEFFSEAYGALRSAGRAGGMMGTGIPIQRRPCPKTCGCGVQYQGASEELLSDLFGA